MTSIETAWQAWRAMVLIDGQDEATIDTHRDAFFSGATWIFRLIEACTGLPDPISDMWLTAIDDEIARFWRETERAAAEEEGFFYSISVSNEGPKS